jgi:hypothetical protein
MITDVPKGSFQDIHFHKDYDWVLIAISFVFISSFSKKSTTIFSVKNGCHVSIGSQWKYSSFPWLPLLAAHIRKRLARAIHTSGGYWFYKTVLIPISHLRPSYPPTHFKLRRR